MVRRLFVVLAMVLSVGACAVKPPAYSIETQVMASVVVPVPVTDA